MARGDPRWEVHRDDVKRWLFVGQGGVCPVCGKRLPPEGWGAVLDHDHAFEQCDPRSWRGVIHQGCNTALGGLGDTAASVLRALSYLLTDRVVTA